MNKENYDRALSLYEKGDLINAETILIELLRNGIEEYSVSKKLAELYSRTSNTKKMIKMLELAIKIAPNCYESYNNLGSIHYEIGNNQLAINYFNKSIILNKIYEEAYYNLGITYQKIGEIEKAINYYEKLIKLNPNFYNLNYNLGTIYHERGEEDIALSFYLKENNANPYNDDCLNNLGNIYKRKEDYSRAIIYYKKAIKINKDNAKAINNLGVSVQAIGNLEDASMYYKKAIKLKPDFYEALNNLGDCLRDLGMIEESIIHLKKAINLKENFQDAIFNLGFAQLLMADYKVGWENYESRFSKSHPCIPHSQPLSVKSSLNLSNADKKLLIISEQGLGDTIQFMRYIPYLKIIGFDILFSAQDKLLDLIKVSSIHEKPLEIEKANKFSKIKWIPLMSIPKMIGVESNKPITNKPYISSTSKLISKWKSTLSSENKLVIGINWQGNPSSEKGVSRGRSFKLELFSKLLVTNDIRFLSLQKGFGSEQINSCSFKDYFVKSQHEINEIWNFTETAAIMKNCDLIITSDTSIAHLAGGMGLKTFLLLKKIPEWRWGLSGNKTFWYPSIKIFRQINDGDWDEVFRMVSIEMSKNINLLKTHKKTNK